MIKPQRLFRFIQRPEYFLRPSQIWRRMRRASLSARNEVRLAWGLPVEVHLESHIGEDILNHGIHDRIVPEAICRLLDSGEQAIDVGANVGQNTSMMALAVGQLGRVTAFEPGALAWSILTRNVERWSGYDLAPIDLVRKGVSSRSGTGLLHAANDLGGFTLEDAPPGDGRVLVEGTLGADIELTTLDAFLPEGRKAALMKIDVEGHELAVLEGARQILGEKCIRDIVFEDFQPQPSPVTLLLESAGYTVLYLYSGWRKPWLVTIEECETWERRAHSEPNFLATTDPERAHARFKEAGWKSLRVRARRDSGR
jgi:FkbM family methyltransferase